MLTKPLHGSQKLDTADEDGNTISIEVIPNNELYQLFLSFGADIEVVFPSVVRSEMKEKINKMYKNY